MALEAGEGSASRPGRSLHPEKARYPLYSRLGKHQCRSGLVRKISPPTQIRSPDRSASSQSLYRLRYWVREFWHGLVESTDNFKITFLIILESRCEIILLRCLNRKKQVTILFNPVRFSACCGNVWLFWNNVAFR
jgi:hypothetical protein